jgi:hypothetical protein
LEGERDDAARHQQHARQVEWVGQFSSEDRGAEREQKRRAPASDRIRLPEIALPVGANEEEVVSGVKQRRRAMQPQLVVAVTGTKGAIRALASAMDMVVIDQSRSSPPRGKPFQLARRAAAIRMIKLRPT